MNSSIGSGERVVGVMQQHLAFADDREDALVPVGRGREGERSRRHPRVVLQIGTRQGVYGPQPREAQRRVVEGHVVRLEVELSQQQLEHLLRHAVVDLEAHGPPEATAAQLHLDRLEEIVGLFFLEREVGVAGDPERHELDDVHAREQRRQVRRDHLLEGDEPLAVGRDHEPRQQRRHLDAGEAVLAGVGVRDGDTEVQGQVRDVREGVTGVERQRREHREDALLVDVDQVLAVLLVEMVPVGDADAGRRERGLDPLEEDLLLL